MDGRGHSRPVARRERRAAAAMIWLALVGFAAGLALAAPPPLFRPGSTMADTDGNRIRAHQPHVYVENGTYYLIGSSHVGASDGSAGIVNLYTSEDLHAWTFQGGVYNHTADARPSLLGRNPRTRQYVLWAKGNSFQVATAPSLRGPYTTVGNFRPSESCTAGDSASFLDPVSGKAYMVYSQHTCGGENARAMMLLQLNDDWTAPAAGAAGKPVPTVAGHLEAPCPFFSELTKKHYIWTSQTSGWSPNPAHLLVSSNGMNGPWADLGNPSNNRTTFSTQGSHIMKLPMADATDPEGHTVERFLYVGDRYEPYINTIEGSRYIFLALEVHASGEVLLKPPVPWGLHDWPAGNGRLKGTVALPRLSYMCLSKFTTESDLSAVRWDAITDLVQSLNTIQFSASGAIAAADPAAWPQLDILRWAHGNATRVTATLHPATKQEAAVFLAKPAALRQATATAVARMVVKAGYDGLQIDVEGLRTQSKAGLESFVGQCAAALSKAAAVAGRATAPTLSVTVYAPKLVAKDFSVYDVARLGQLANFVFIMGYDMHRLGTRAGKAWQVAGPNAPVARPAPSLSPCFVPGLLHVVLSTFEPRQAPHFVPVLPHAVARRMLSPSPCGTLWPPEPVRTPSSWGSPSTAVSSCATKAGSHHRRKGPPAVAPARRRTS